MIAQATLMKNICDTKELLMKKILSSALIGCLFLSGYTLSSFAADASTPERATVSVNTNSNAEISPDTVEISVSIKTKDNKSLQKAATENKLISDKVYSSFKAMINSQNGDYVKTADYAARPVYSYNNNKKIFDRYEVNNSVIVHTRNIDMAGSIIDKAISLGASDVNYLNFSVSNYEDKCLDLLNDVSQKAKKRADIVAKSSGTYVTGVKNMNLTCSENSSNRVQYKTFERNMALMATDGAAAAPEVATPIQYGTIKIFANLNAVYFIK